MSFDFRSKSVGLYGERGDIAEITAQPTCETGRDVAGSQIPWSFEERS